MNIPVIAGFASADSPPPPQGTRDSTGGDDLFGNLLHGQMNVAPTSPPPASSSNGSPPTPVSNGSDNKPATSDTADNSDSSNGAQQSDAANSANGAQQSSDGSSETSSQAAKATDKNDSTDNTKAKDAGKTKDAAKKKDDSGAQVSDQAAVMPAIAALATPVATKEPGSVPAGQGGDAASAAAVTPATPPGTGAAPTSPEADTKPETPAPNASDAANPGQNGNAPFQAEITVADEGQNLVSRPAATLAPAHAAELAANGQKPRAAADDKNAPAPAQNADSAQSTADKTQAGGKPAADHAGASDSASSAPLPADGGSHDQKPAGDMTVQTQPAAPNAAAAPMHAADAQGGAAPQMQAVASAPRPAAVAVPTTATFDQVAIQIGKAAAVGIDTISIQLKPESLGRIDVQLQVAHDGHVNATIAAHQQSTLDLLRRDSYSLQRALEDAGLHTDAGSLSFNLSGQGNGNASSQPFSGTAAAPTGTGTDAADSAMLPLAASIATNSAAARGGIDIRV